MSKTDCVSARVAAWRVADHVHRAVGRGEEDRKATSKRARASKGFRAWTETITAAMREEANRYWTSVEAAMKQGIIHPVSPVAEIERERNEVDIDSFEVE